MQTEPWNEKLWGLGKTYFFLRLKCKSSLSFSIAFVLSGTLDFKQTIIFLSSLGVMTLRLLLSLYLSSGTSANTCHGNEDKKLCFHYPCMSSGAFLKTLFPSPELEPIFRLSSSWETLNVSHESTTHSLFRALRQYGGAK